MATRLLNRLLVIVSLLILSATAAPPPDVEAAKLLVGSWVLSQGRNSVIVKDAGLNGVMITEDEETQRFELSAESWALATEHPIFVVGRIETASPQRSDFPAEPLTLIIQAKQNAARAGQ